MKMITVTLEQLRTKDACFDIYNKVVRMLQNKPYTADDGNITSYIHFNHTDEISLAAICRNNGVDDALWATRCLDSTHVRDLRLFAVWCVRMIQHLLTDERSIRVIDVAERFANGDATEEELELARVGAWDAYAASNTAHSVAQSVAQSVAHSAAYFAARAIVDTKRLEQTEMLIKMCEGNAPWQLEEKEKKMDYPKVTLDNIESIIQQEVFFTAAEGASYNIEYKNTHPSLSLLTFCILVLKNGFTVTGESACVSPENFNADIGKKIARENAINKIWMLEGYRLKQQLSE